MSGFSPDRERGLIRLQPDRLTARPRVEYAVMPHHRREVSRIEGFSDAVFAFAITLLVVSLEVPETFDELSNLGLGAIGLASAAVAAIMGRLAPNLVGVAG